MTERPHPQSLQAALGYLLRSWSVMAVPARTKKRTRRWKQWQGRRPTSVELREDFAAEGDDANVAMICGMVSGVVVVDPDSPGALVLVEQQKPPHTLRVRTARGVHLYFRCTARLRSRKLTVPDGGSLELRAERSYVLAPPSRHPSGLLYAFEDPEAPLAELPQAILDLFSTKTPPSPNSNGLPPRWVQMVSRWGEARSVWHGGGDHPDRTGSGRDMKLAHFLRKAGFSREEVRAIVVKAPYPVDGGRGESYLTSTVDKAFAFAGTRPRPRSGYGQLPNWIIASGTYAKLSRRAKAALMVLVKHAERPSFIVRISMKRLAAEGDISIDRVGRATDELAAAGVIRKSRAMGGRWNIWIQHEPPLTYSAESAEHVSESLATQAAQRAPHAHSTPPRLRRSAEYVSPPDSAVGAEHVVSDSRMKKRDPDAAPASPHPRRREVAAPPSPAPPSMRLDQELDGRGGTKVFRVLGDGRRILVWQGRISDWLSWSPPECLRYEARMAEWPRVGG